MDNRIENIKKFRHFLLNQIEGLSVEQLNKIPDGFNNNIIWNLAHLIAAQQGICYLRAAQAAIVPEKYIVPFFTNTKPEKIIDQQETDEIKRLFISTIEQLQTDFDKKIFNSYTPSPNVFKLYDIEMKSIDEALEFLLYHEGYHSSYVLTIKRLLS